LGTKIVEFVIGTVLKRYAKFHNFLPERSWGCHRLQIIGKTAKAIGVCSFAARPLTRGNGGILEGFK